MLPVKLSESMTSGSQMRGGFGCLVDLGLFGLAWIFPPLWFVIIPLWCYEGIVGLREYYYKYKRCVSTFVLVVWRKPNFYSVNFEKVDCYCP